METKISKLVSLTIIGLFLLISGTQATEFSSGVMLGYNGGPSFQINGSVGKFAQGFPFKMEIGAAYARMDAGSSLDARRIFINDATNGDPEKQGTLWDFRLDLLYQVKWFSLNNLYVYGGPRYSMFNANFNFIGGNEVFDIGSNQWGWGLGFKGYFPMSRKLDFVLTTGADYYLESAIEGHDTKYSPDGEDVNPRNDYKFNDADDAINQPKLKMRIMLGLNYSF